jgi:MFS family permease
LLASAPDLTTFTILRILQGLCMASAFALTLAYLGEQCSPMDAGGAFAAHITGNVASYLIERLVSAAVVDTFGLASNFYFFALLNLPGAGRVTADRGDATFKVIIGLAPSRRRADPPMDGKACDHSTK